MIVVKTLHDHIYALFGFIEMEKKLLEFSYSDIWREKWK